MYARYQDAQRKADEAAERLGGSSLTPALAMYGVVPEVDAVLPLPSLAALPPSAGGPDAVRKRCASSAREGRAE